MLTLYQFPISHYCEIARWALDFKQLDYKPVNLLPGRHSKVTTQIAPGSSVPVLKHDETIIQGSGNILSYLDEQFPQHPLTPIDNNEKQSALEWERFLDRQVGIPLRCFMYYHLLKTPSKVIPMWAHNGPLFGTLTMWLMFPVLRMKMCRFMKINQETAEQSRQTVLRAVDHLYQAKQEKMFLVGKNFSRADLSAASLLSHLVQPVEVDLFWPRHFPQAIQQLIDETRKKNTWIVDTYENYRKKPPT